MHEQTVAANCYIIREGDDGGHLYVGEVVVEVVLCTYNSILKSLS
ncbi:hypothetical protein KSF78_0008380 [Schistosoma japonicum]|nr:hypothetical protein KSF78_0008380 [Schistosoma japonicum]